VHEKIANFNTEQKDIWKSDTGVGCLHQLPPFHTKFIVNLISLLKKYNVT